jgi:pyruvate kinase
MSVPRYQRYTKIIATLGPASNDVEMMGKMAQRGMDVARINFSHGTRRQHQAMVDNLRAMNQKFHQRVTLLQDLAGYRIRVGVMAQPRKMIENKQIVYMSNEPEWGNEHIPFDFDDDLSRIEIGSLVFIDDGRLSLKVLAREGRRLKLRVLQGGWLKERKGMNIRGLILGRDVMTEQDRLDLDFGIKVGFEKIAHSFVRNSGDIQRVVEIVRDQNPTCKVIAKIENEEGVKNIESIVDACDGVMVARGDLGVTIPLYKIPIIQKYIINHCNRKKKLSITATQMLESMVSNGHPTRAEVSDVANAILDGSDYVMLSGETAVGRFPSRVAQTMRQIIQYTENSKFHSLRL